MQTPIKVFPSVKGSDAEQLAASYLQRRQLILIEQNYRCRFGEIDLIMRENATLVFVEVRMRSSDVFGGASASITAAKQKKSAEWRIFVFILDYAYGRTSRCPT